MAQLHDEHYLKAVTDLGDSRPVLANEAIYAANGMLLVKKGTCLNSRLYEHLVQHKLGTPIDQSLSTEGAVTTAQLVEAIERLLAELPLCARLVAHAGEGALVRTAVSGVVLPSPIAFKLTVARERRPELFRHSCLVTLIAAHLGGWAGLGSGEMQLLAAASMLHDLGMLHVDPALLDAAHHLSLEERRYLYAHPLTSMLIVQQALEYPAAVATAVFEHHERMDGTGYPRGLYGERISHLGRILLLSEVAATVFGRDDLPFAELQLSVMLQLNRHKFDPVMWEHLVDLVSPHPPEVSMDRRGEDRHRIERLAGEFEQWTKLRASVRARAENAPSGGAFLLHRVDALERLMADAGFHPDQLAALTRDIENDPRSIEELALLARETGWQLREIIREIWRRWPELATSTESGERALMVWLKDLDQRLRH